MRDIEKDESFAPQKLVEMLWFDFAPKMDDNLSSEIYLTHSWSAGEGMVNRFAKFPSFPRLRI